MIDLTKRAKRKKSKPLPYLRKKLWTIVSHVIRRMNADHKGDVTCVTCDKQLPWQEAHCGHFVPRARGIACYFEYTNLHPQCPGCNFYGGEMVKIKYTQWMLKTYGQEEVDRLVRLAGTIKKITRADYEEMIDHYQQCADLLR